MLLRTAAFLLLFTSLGTCATLVYYQTEATKVEAPALEPAADGDGTGSTTEGEAAVDAQVSDSSAADSPFGNKPLAKIFLVNNQGGDRPETETYVTHDATAKELEADSKKPAGESPAVEALLSGEAVNVEQVSSQEEANEIRPVQTNNSPNKPPPQEDASIWSLNSIRNSFQTVHGYFDSLVELAGGHNGVCQYRCRHGGRPQPRPGYQLPEPNGCSSTLMGFQLDVGIPAMTKCCNQLDACYDVCGRNKYDCDAKFRVCLHAICSDLRRSLGFVSKVQACESMADGLYNTVWTLGCRPYMNSQRAACVCPGEEKDEL